MSTKKKLREEAAEAALAAMSAEELRKLVREMLGWLEDKPRAMFLNELVDHAARTAGAWSPKGPAAKRVRQIERFAEAAAATGWADPADMDDSLREGQIAFLARDYTSALRILRALLTALRDGEVQMGQDELVDEVLGTDVATCAAQLVVCVYMTAEPEDRAQAVRAALDEADWAGYFAEPLETLEETAVEPLPEFEDFIEQWRELVTDLDTGGRPGAWSVRRVESWRREVASRVQGPEGLAKLARRTRAPDDLRAWCRALVDSDDWPAAMAAYDEAAELVEGSDSQRAGFLEGAALAAQQIGACDLEERLERAWRLVPTFPRLARWLGWASSRKALRERAAAALVACPTASARQRSLLYVLCGELSSAAQLLAEAPGLGWSFSDHPGHLVVPVFQSLLGEEGVDLDAREVWAADLSRIGRDKPRLKTPKVAELLEGAGISSAELEVGAGAVRQALRAAAERRVAEVTSKGRRRRYRHAARLAVDCARAEGDAEAQRWLEGLKRSYRRYSALQREFRAAEV